MPRMLIAIAVISACDKPTLEPVRPSAEVEAAQCVRDDDCVLLPAELSCCIECPPSPPFEAAPAWVLDGMLIENETTCAEPRHLCLPDPCVRIPETCVARAACVAGTCVAVAEGCDR